MSSAGMRVSVLAWLTVVYMWLWGDFSIGNALAGAVVALAITLLLPLPTVPARGRARFYPLCGVITLTAWYALVSSVHVAWLAVRPRQPISGVLRVHMSIESDLVLVLCCDTLNLIPGSMVLEIDKDHRVVYVHVLDMGSERSVAEFYRTTARLEQLFVRAFEGRDERNDRKSR